MQICSIFIPFHLLLFHYVTMKESVIRTRKFNGLPDPLIKDTDPDLSIIMQK